MRCPSKLSVLGPYHIRVLDHQQVIRDLQAIIGLKGQINSELQRKLAYDKRRTGAIKRGPEQANKRQVESVSCKYVKNLTAISKWMENEDAFKYAIEI